MEITHRWFIGARLISSARDAMDAPSSAAESVALCTEQSTILDREVVDRRAHSDPLGSAV